MGLPVTVRRYLTGGVASVCYRDEDRYVVLVSPSVQDRLDHGRARREAFRRAREWGHDIVALTFEELDELRERDAARIEAGVRFFLRGARDFGQIA